MKVSVIGTGYVGLVSGVCLAEKGHRVVCVDNDRTKIDMLNAAVPPIHENGLEALLKRNLHDRLEATTDLHRSVRETDLSLLAVGTPFDGAEIDLQYVRAAALQIGEALRSKDAYHTVVVKSTVVPGTTENIVLPLLEQGSGKKAGVHFGVGMNPEFLREGEAIQDFMFPDRIVLGGIDTGTMEALEELYAVFEGVDKLRTTPKTAEMIKYASNSLLATMISFSNEIGNLCAALGSIDVVEVMRGVHLDKRLSPILPGGNRIVPAFTTYLEAGCGFGGSCFPKDVKALIAHGKKAGRPMALLDAVIQVNESQPRQVLSLLRKHFPYFSGVRVAVLGLAFKPGTDDMRESPAIPIIRELLEERAEIRAYDPVAAGEARKLFGNSRIAYCDDLAQTLEEAEVVLLLTRWPEFQQLPIMLENVESPPLVIDGRRMLDKSGIVRYEGIGL
ncbi:UDP-glucose/GDP-mannose dehydrogenase family protein [Desulfuromonas sp. TF]|uniref:UDP-glucose dehydrogenase family protein n=1 Tax=Desulfuromonas sp. TF TaxID=1232410 RepID=UPI00040D72BA|nr:UDP-glucose/GDP-mannose dehydrogenase family protein [Desulfuromonas sp. TF]